MKEFDQLVLCRAYTLNFKALIRNVKGMQDPKCYRDSNVRPNIEA